LLFLFTIHPKIPKNLKKTDILNWMIGTLPKVNPTRTIELEAIYDKHYSFKLANLFNFTISQLDEITYYVLEFLTSYPKLTIIFPGTYSDTHFLQLSSFPLAVGIQINITSQQISSPALRKVNELHGLQYIDLSGIKSLNHGILADFGDLLELKFLDVGLKSGFRTNIANEGFEDLTGSLKKGVSKGIKELKSIKVPKGMSFGKKKDKNPPPEKKNQ